jgi:hypothetical protein
VLEIIVQSVAPEYPERVIRLYLDTSHGCPLTGVCADRMQLSNMCFDVYPEAATFQTSRSVIYVAQNDNLGVDQFSAKYYIKEIFTFTLRVSAIFEYVV